jgi:hypothetical protein
MAPDWPSFTMPIGTVAWILPDRRPMFTREVSAEATANVNLGPENWIWTLRGYYH